MIPNSHAIVIGGSMAGLLTARVLSEHFAKVTIIERDIFADTPDFRSGVPQGRHIHALLAQGQRIMEELFPGLADDFKEIGAPHMEWGTDTATLTAGGWVNRFPMGYYTNLISRVALEYLIRKRLALHGNVEFLPETDVVSLSASSDRGTIRGVTIEPRGEKRAQSGSTAHSLTADLVVDASGRNSKSLEWLTALGYDAPQETTVYAYIGYATRWYEMPADKPDWKVLFINGRPEEGMKRGGGVFEVEGGRWVVTLSGVNRDYPPTDEAGFLDFAKSLPSPALYEAIKDAKPTSPIYGYRYDGNRLRHFEKMPRCPENFIVVGDAACGFNPIYGQGMTMAALEALELGKLLPAFMAHSNLTGFAAAYYAKFARAIKNPWLLATGEDLRYPETEGAKPNALAKVVQSYVNRMVRALPEDRVLSLAFIKVFNMTHPPVSLLTPGLALRVLRHMLKSGKMNAREESAVPPRPSATNMHATTASSMGAS